MLSQEKWEKIVEDAINEYLRKKNNGQPMWLPAAPLKPLLVRQAKENGLSFPPEEHSHIKFVEFLNLFPLLIKIQRRPGRDVLIARTCDIEFLNKFAPDQFHLRDERLIFRLDVFRAFTKILPDEYRFYYDKATDNFQEIEVGSGDESFVMIPVNSIDDSVSERKKFAECFDIDDSKRNILSSAVVDSLAPLGSFSQAVKKLRLENEWHNFRFNVIKNRIKKWAEAEEIDWNPAWINGEKPIRKDIGVVVEKEVNFFWAELMNLGSEDAKRVMVPLDIVLKLMRHD